VSTELAYLADPFQLEFDAEIIDRVTLPNGRAGVILRKTFFYPTGGGQEHDVGMLGDARVTDVLIDDAGIVVNVVDRAITDPRVYAKIDRARRFAFMQHHSAQHLLSQAIDETLGLETVSANINIDTPSTIDLAIGHHGDVDLTPGENRANALIYEDRPIKSYFISDDQIHTIPFRRPPKVSGQIRVVEIDGCDYSACGGTHCTRTGMIGVVKIVKLERRAEKLRVSFLAGWRAFEYFRNVHSIVTQVARQFDTNPDAVGEVVERQREVLRAAQKELDELKAERVTLEAQRLVASAQAFGSIRLVVAPFRNRAPQELRALAMQLQNVPGVVAMLASHDGTKLSLAVACARDTGISANELIRKQLAEIGGRGGGDAQLAQGGGAASEAQFQLFSAHTGEYVRALRER
jgi:alanyl-tRNA synthetase